MRLLAIGILSLASVSSGTNEPSWGWRGDGTGRFPQADPPTEWSATKNVTWSLDLGPLGYSSPVVANNRVFLTSEPNRLHCVDLTEGKLLWRAAISASDLAGGSTAQASKSELHSGNVAATPLCTETQVFVVLGNGIVACLDHHGKRVWTRSFGQDYVLSHGRSASPILCDGKVIVQLHYTVALDPADGKVLWEAPQATATYGTPARSKIGDTPVIVTPGGRILRAGDGKVIATNLPAGVNSSPLVLDGVCYLIEREIAGHRLPEQAKEAGRAAEVFADVLDGECFASPLLHDGLLYTISSQGCYRVIDARSGKVTEKELDFAVGERGGDIYASPCLAGGFVFVTSTSGRTLVLEPGTECKVVAANTLDAGRGATPFFVGKAVLLCTKTKLVCISK
jgi:outer membrane protein assembly factor BamB